MNKFEHFKYPLLESCWDGYIPGGEHLFNQISSEKQAEKPWAYIEQDNIRAMITAITDGVNNHMLDFSKLEG